ncbi:hypothetical protein QE429_002817 [Bacillus sp. SORGH_AS 510]|uniref:hypothetical protein n=1 Tax=Bacillus sp. SORGH_AS_0510 TaxID=3041771 RepID=UPI002788C8E2|nr:hypothetical protein [Bacillus sp. SORGH_AS_0510]MDQ1145990.1 hypothetical protein [Bacillus sp. SORGH_AS_0510]
MDMNILLSFLQILFVSFLELLYLFGVIIAVGLVLGVLERYSNTYLIKAFGSRGVMLTAWIGTPIHEIGHLIQCFIWGHRVTRMKLLQLNSPSGVLGFVEHQYNRNSWYQQAGNFFIGLGPIFSGIGSIILSMYFLMPETYHAFVTEIHRHVTIGNLEFTFVKIITGAVLIIYKTLFTVDNLFNRLFWIFLIIAICISSHIALSRADIEGAAKGLITIYFLLLLFNLIAAVFQMNSYGLIVKISQMNAFVLAFSSVALFFSLLTLLISILVYSIIKKIR